MMVKGIKASRSRAVRLRAVTSRGTNVPPVMGPHVGEGRSRSRFPDMRQLLLSAKPLTKGSTSEDSPGIGDVRAK